MNFLSDFINKIISNGIQPHNTADVIPTESFKRIRSSLDRTPLKKTLSYWLRIEHDFAYGYAKDFKTGVEYRYKSYNNDSSLSRADLARIKTLMKARQAEQDAAIADRQLKISVRAKSLWAKASISGSSEYNTRKSINPFTARYLGNTILVPVYEPYKGDNGALGLDLVSYQTIKPDGTKRFPFGGKKKGCCHVIGTINPNNPLIICEGYATGLTLHDATKLPVVVAWDAYNLLAIAKIFRGIFKTTKIIVAADNDELKPNQKYKVGEKYANDVKESIPNVEVIVCPDEDKDFNDIGVERTKECFSSPTPTTIEITTPTHADDDWQSWLLTDKKGYVLATSMQNISIYTMHHPSLKGMLAYDTFKQQVLVKAPPPWADESKFKVAPVSDTDITRLTGYLETFGLSPSHDKTFKAINLAAEENSFNSAADYISTLVWDGVPRLESFLVDIGCNKERPNYLAFVFKKWMTAAVKRIFEPGCKFDHVLILESQQQGLYKSSALKELATFNGESYYTDAFQINNIGNEYDYLKLQGVTFVELSEFAGFGKKDDEIIKNWITQTEDSVRLPYDRTVSKFLRKFVLCSTTNNYDYLKDPTGNRRYWPVTITKHIDIKYLSQIKEQLWAEAYHNYMNGLYIGPTPEENDLADKERAKRMQTDAWEGMVLDAVKKIGLDEFTTNEVIDLMSLKSFEKNEKTVKRVGKVLTGLGYENNPQWNSSLKKTVRVWSR